MNGGYFLHLVHFLHKHPPCQMMIVEEDGQPVIYIEFDGKRIAERAHPDSPQARTWVSLEPGFQVPDGERHRVRSLASDIGRSACRPDRIAIHFGMACKQQGETSDV